MNTRPGSRNFGGPLLDEYFVLTKAMNEDNKNHKVSFNKNEILSITPFVKPSTDEDDCHDLEKNRRIANDFKNRLDKVFGDRISGKMFTYADYCEALTNGLRLHKIEQIVISIKILSQNEKAPLLNRWSERRDYGTFTGE